MHLVRKKSEDLKDSFYEQLEEVFNHFPKYHMKILLGDFNAKVGRESIFKPIMDRIVSIRIVTIMGLE